MIRQAQLYVFPRLSELICVLAHVKGVTDREMLRNIVLNVNKSVVFLSRNNKIWKKQLEKNMETILGGGW